MKKLKLNRVVPDNIKQNLLEEQEKAKGPLFGELTVIGYGGRKRGYTFWTCRCSCGDVSDYIAPNLIRGRSTRCVECGHRSRRKPVVEKTPTQHAWEYAKTKHEVCKEWENFEQFLKDMGEKPVGSWLRRKDPSKPHGPGNSLWWTHQHTHLTNVHRIVKIHEKIGKPLTPKEVDHLRSLTRQGVHLRLKALREELTQYQAIRKGRARGNKSGNVSEMQGS